MKSNAKVEWVLCFVVFYIFVMVLTWMAIGNAEERSLEVIGFDFETSEVLLEDEDGYVWTCPFGKNEWTLGDEYILVLADGEEPQIVEP